ncbi:MAG: BlaI/MecI/CopY family transcriptional regulator [bacterium]|nr:BlaI/MecI/CopY family transcriptional regulator [bacterium]
MERPPQFRLPGGQRTARSRTGLVQTDVNEVLPGAMASLRLGSDLTQLAPLSPLELEIMDLVWDLEECTSAEVISAYARIRRLADTTIRTVLTNIRKKGYLELVPSIDRGHRFRPTRSREQVTRQTLYELVARLFKGRAREAIMLLLSDDLMTARDLEEIRRIVEGHQIAVKTGP